MRLETINSLTMLFRGAGKAASDQVIKEVVKQLRVGLADKAMIIKVTSAEVLLHPGLFYCSFINDVSR